MSVLDLIPDAEREAAEAFVRREQRERGSLVVTYPISDVAIVWCVMKLLGELEPTAETKAAARLIEERDAEIVRLNELLAATRDAFADCEMRFSAALKRSEFVDGRVIAMMPLFQALRGWALAYGGAAQDDSALQADFYACAERLAEIEVKERDYFAAERRT